MTVNTDIGTAGPYVLNGVTVAFPVSFYWLVDTDIMVTYLTATTGTTRVLVLNSDYTLSGAGNNSGGTLTLLAAQVSGDQIYVERDIDFVQLTAYPSNSSFPASSHEKALDRDTMGLQQLNTQVGRALSHSPLGTTYDLETGTLINSGAAINPADVPNYSQVAAMVVAGGSPTLALPVGAAAVGFQQTGTGGAARTVQAKLFEYVTDTDFGAVGNGAVDDTVAMQRAAATGKLVYCLGSSYKLSANVLGNFTFAKAVTYTGTGQLHSLGIQQPNSGTFWSSSGAAVNRFGDRVFIGDAVVNDGALPNVNKDWLSTYFSTYTPSSYYSEFAQGMSLTSIGGGFLGGAHTAGGGTNSNAYGLNAFALADHASATTFAWGIYAEGHRVNSHGGNCYGMELAIVNRGGTISNTPYSGGAGSTIGIQLDSGAGFTAAQMPGVVSASTGLQFVNNIPGSGSTGGFLNGICFGATSLNGTDGVTGTGVAIAMAKGHALQWFSGAGSPTTTIICNGLTTANSANLLFAENSVSFTNANGGQNLLSVPTVPSAANYPSLSAATTGNPVVIAAGGSDANIDLLLAPKGTGLLKTNYIANNATNSANFIAGKRLQFKDSTGTIFYIAAATTPW